MLTITIAVPALDGGTTTTVKNRPVIVSIIHRVFLVSNAHIDSKLLTDYQMMLYIMTSYRVLSIVYLDQLSGACHTHISYHDKPTT